MKTLVFAITVLAAVAVPGVGMANTVDPAYIPDGQYVVKVERVEDSHHCLVMMQNGIETTLVARGDVDFSKLKPNDSIKIAMLKGQVPVFEVQ